MSFQAKDSWWALRVLSRCYRSVDTGLSDDIDARLDSLGAPRLIGIKDSVDNRMRFVSTRPPVGI